MVKIRFSFEDLEIWQKSVEFTKIVVDLAEKKLKRPFYSKKEFIQFLYIARGSLL